MRKCNVKGKTANISKILIHSFGGQQALDRAGEQGRTRVLVARCNFERPSLERWRKRRPPWRRSPKTTPAFPAWCSTTQLQNTMSAKSNTMFGRSHAANTSTTATAIASQSPRRRPRDSGSKRMTSAPATGTGSSASGRRAIDMAAIIRAGSGRAYSTHRHAPVSRWPQVSTINRAFFRAHPTALAHRASRLQLHQSVA